MKKLIIVIALFLPILVSANTSGIKISEIAASESSGFEWVEITNTGSTPIDLSAWKFFEDNTNHKLSAVRGANTIAPGEYAVIAQDAAKLVTKYPNLTHVFDSSWTSLKESGEYIALKDGSNVVEEGFTYLSAPKGFLARTDVLRDDYTSANWKEMDQSTIGQVNNPVVVAPPASPSPPPANGSSNSPLQASSPTTTTSPTVTTASSQSSSAPSIPITTLTVTVPPGVFGMRTMYGEHDGIGYEIYSYYSSFPALLSGDEITVRGELVTTNLLHRIKIKQSTDIVKIGAASIVPLDLTAIELDNTVIGRLAAVRGSLLTIRGRNQFVVEYDGHEIEVVLKTNTGLSLSHTAEGTPIRVQGIIGFRDGNFILYPRMASDLSVTMVSKNTTVKIATVSKETPPPPLPVPTTKNTPLPLRTIGLTLILLGASALIALLIRNRDKIFKRNNNQDTITKND